MGDRFTSDSFTVPDPKIPVSKAGDVNPLYEIARALASRGDDASTNDLLMFLDTRGAAPKTFQRTDKKGRQLEDTDVGLAGELEMLADEGEFAGHGDYPEYPGDEKDTFDDAIKRPLRQKGEEFGGTVGEALEFSDIPEGTGINRFDQKQLDVAKRRSAEGLAEFKNKEDAENLEFANEMLADVKLKDDKPPVPPSAIPGPDFKSMYELLKKMSRGTP